MSVIENTSFELTSCLWCIFPLRMFSSVAKTMKNFLVASFLTIAFIPPSLGKNYLIATDDGDDTDELDLDTVDAEILIHAVLKDEDLDEFENLPEKDQIEIIRDIDKIIENARNGDEDVDYNIEKLGTILRKLKRRWAKLKFRLLKIFTKMISNKFIIG